MDGWLVTLRLIVQATFGSLGERAMRVVLVKRLSAEGPDEAAKQRCAKSPSEYAIFFSEELGP